MFSSLDRVDLVYTGPDGRVRWLQSDHRPPPQIEAEAELSLLFAIIRLVDPRRDFPPGDPPPVLEYRCQHLPPAFLRAAIASAGAELVVDEPIPYEGIAPDPEALVHLACTALAARVARERDVPCDLAGLAELEATATTLDHDADEVAYWRAVLHWAAFTGEALRLHAGGSWRLCTGDQAGALSLMFVTADERPIDLIAAAIARTEGVADASMRACIDGSL